MNKAAVVLTVFCLVISGACLNRHDREVKAHMEADYELYHQQLERERAIAAYQNSPAYKAKIAKEMRERYGNMSQALHELKVP